MLFLVFPFISLPSTVADELVWSSQGIQKNVIVIPAKAGIQSKTTGIIILDSRFRGNDIV